jgi:hypothetical protein
LGVALPLIVGAAIGQTSGGLLAAIGALNVSYSDGVEPYRQRARRMLAASCFGALAVGAGGLLGREHLMLIALTALMRLRRGNDGGRGPDRDRYRRHGAGHADRLRGASHDA